MTGRRVTFRGQGPPSELVEEYLGRVRENLVLLEEMIEDLRSGDPEAADRIRALGHKYRGTGASFGFSDISEAGELVELASEEELEEAAESFAEVLRRSIEEKSEPSRLLLIDDDEMVRALVEGTFRNEGVSIEAEESVAGAWAALTDHEYDAVILDLFLEDGDGRQLLTEMREHPTTSRLPVVVVSGHGTDAVQAECMRLGADAYLPKPLDPEVLAATIIREIDRFRRLDEDSRLDSITQLPNRAALAERYQELASQAQRKGTPLALVRIELDQIESVRVELGRMVAGKLLAEFASVVSPLIREAGVVGRWEGSELLALLSEMGVEEATAFFEEILDDVRDREFSVASEPGAEGVGRLHMSFSAGVVDATDFKRLSEAVLEAERGLVAARASGGGAVAARVPEEGVQDIRKIIIVEDDDAAAQLYRHRLERDGFEVTRFATGIEAADFIEEEDGGRYDLMLLDIKLPGRDGYEILQLARGRQAWKDLPVVVITAMGREAHVVRAFELGADDYIMKPFAAAELLARVHRFLR